MYVDKSCSWLKDWEIHLPFPFFGSISEEASKKILLDNCPKSLRCFFFPKVPPGILPVPLPDFFWAKPESIPGEVVRTSPGVLLGVYQKFFQQFLHDCFFFKTYLKNCFRNSPENPSGVPTKTALRILLMTTPRIPLSNPLEIPTSTPCRYSPKISSANFPKNM